MGAVPQAPNYSFSWPDRALTSLPFHASRVARRFSPARAARLHRPSRPLHADQATRSIQPEPPVTSRLPEPPVYTGRAARSMQTRPPVPYSLSHPSLLACLSRPFTQAEPPAPCSLSHPSLLACPPPIHTYWGGPGVCITIYSVWGGLSSGKAAKINIGTYRYRIVNYLCPGC